MLIRVLYRNRKYDMVKDFFLEDLIAKGRIERFHRSGGWVEIGRDPIRQKTRTNIYTGPERREPVVQRPLSTLIRIGKQHCRPVFAGQVVTD